MKIRTVVATLFITLVLIVGVIVSSMVDAPEPSTYQIVDKYEHEGNCYIAIEQEITPEEYIGYDVGDEYERSE